MRLVSLLLLTSACQSAVDPQASAEKRALANVAYDEGRFEDCGRLFGEAAVAGRRVPSNRYDAACCYARAEKADLAMFELARAVDTGFYDSRALETDADLDALRGSARFDGIVEAARLNRDALVGRGSRELLGLFEEDQARQRSVDREQAITVDRARIARVEQIIGEDHVITGDDHFFAAFILQHGETPEQYARAHALAQKAVEAKAKDDRARWLVAATIDRYLHSIGRPQIYGTQMHVVDGRWTLEPFDAEGATDADRGAMDVPPLAEALRDVGAMQTQVDTLYDGGQNG